MKPKVVKFTVTPTELFVREDGALKQVVAVDIADKYAKQGRVRVEMPTASFEIDLKVIPLYQGKARKINFISRGKYFISVPEVSQPTPAKFTLVTPDKREYPCSVIIKPCKHWKLFITPHTHLDVGYTDIQDEVWEFQAGNLDKVISLCKETRDWPEGTRFKWTCEVSRLIKNYIQRRTPGLPREMKFILRGQLKALLDLIKKGTIEVAGLYLNEPTELTGHEELVRTVYYMNELRKRFGIEVRSAMLDDVPGYTWVLPQILSKAGIKYLAVRANPYHAQPLWEKAAPRSFSAEIPRWKAVPRPFIWKGPDGSEILTWYTDSYRDGNFFREEDAPHEEEVLRIIEKNEKAGYPFDAIQLRMGGDNIEATLATSISARRWNQRWAYPEVIVATNSEFFKYMERYRSEFPVIRGDISSWWADGAASSAYETGLNRVTHDQLVTAEKLCTIAGITNPDYPYPAKSIEEAYDETLLYDEHTWGASASISEPYSLQTKAQWAIKSSHSYKAAIKTQKLLQDGLRALARQIETSDDFTIAVFNSLSWRRTDIVQVTVSPEMLGGKKHFKIVDTATGEIQPYQVIGRNEKNGSVDISFTARDVPATGYRAYRLIPKEKQSGFEDNITFRQGMLENRFYKVFFDPAGGISSIYDKELERELVDQNSKYKLNQYVYERPEVGRDFMEDVDLKTEFHRSSPSHAKVTPGDIGPVMGSVILDTSGERCPQIVHRVTLYADIKRIDLVNTLTKEETLDSEGVYYIFPFDIKDPKVKFEIAGAVMSPEVDQLKGSCKDFYSVQHWVNVSNSGYGVTLATIEAPLVQFGDITTGRWLDKPDVSNGTIVSWIMNNYWNTNFKASQGGILSFRYAITSHKNDWGHVYATQFGWESSNPLIALVIPKNQRGALSPISYSFLEIDRPNVMVLALKRAEDDRGYIVRLQELDGTTTTVRVTLPFFTSVEAILTDITENDLEPLEALGNIVTIRINGFGIATVRLLAGD